MMATLAHFLNSDKIRTEDVIVEQNVTFKSLLLPPKILSALDQNGFRKPSPIQMKAIPVGRCGFDLIVNAKSGTGKTLVFSIIALENVDVSECIVQALILAPTREIAIQIQHVLKQIGQNYEGLKVESFIGGLPVANDIKMCKQCHIAVGTPGRLKQLIIENYLNVDSVQILILDEADKLMEVSFKKDIDTIYNALPVRKQIITSSATYPDELKNFLCNYMLTPTQVAVDINTPLLLGVKQFVHISKLALNSNQQMKLKNQQILQILENISFTQCLIFSNYQMRTESICNMLNKTSWKATFISAAQSQNTRMESLDCFKNFKYRILLSTDLSARGIDIANVDLVINYDIPNDPLTYLHRMGRAGRYGSFGICINLVSDGKELQLLKQILGSIGGSTLSIPVISTFHANDILENNAIKNHIYGVSPVAEEFSSAFKNDILNRKGYMKKMSHDMDNNSTDRNGTISPNKCIKQKSQVFKLVTPAFMTNNNEACTSNNIEIFPIQTSQNKPEDIVVKNKALLTISKLISNCIECEDDSSDVIRAYLEQLKRNETVLKGNPVMKHFKESLDVPKYINLINSSSGNHSKNIKPAQSSNWENIFQLAYDLATSTKLQENCLQECNLNNSNKISSNKISARKEFQDDNNIMKRAPTQTSAQSTYKSYIVHKRNVLGRYQHFSKYFDGCSLDLWHGGLNFHSVQAFDEWFHCTWQTKVLFAKHYIQQNIYIQEMSDFYNVNMNLKK